MGGGQGKYNILVYIAFERVIVVIKNDKETHAAKRSFETKILRFHIFERDLSLNRSRIWIKPALLLIFPMSTLMRPSLP